MFSIYGYICQQFLLEAKPEIPRRGLTLSARVEPLQELGEDNFTQLLSKPVTASRGLRFSNLGQAFEDVLRLVLGAPVHGCWISATHTLFFEGPRVITSALKSNQRERTFLFDFTEDPGHAAEVFL